MILKVLNVPCDHAKIIKSPECLPTNRSFPRNEIFSNVTTVLYAGNKYRENSIQIGDLTVSRFAGHPLAGQGVYPKERNRHCWCTRQAPLDMSLNWIVINQHLYGGGNSNRTGWTAVGDFMDTTEHVPVCSS